MTDIPVPDWGAYFKNATQERLKVIGIEPYKEGRNVVTLADMAEDYDSHVPSERCLFTVIRRPKDKVTCWYQVRRYDPQQRLCHAATIKRGSVNDWELSKYTPPTRAFTLQAPGDSSPRDVLDAAVERGFQL